MADERVSKMAEMSLVAFVKIVAAVNKSPIIADYRSHPGLQQCLGSTFRVSLTFGLHKGWAIEGAIGTEFKIDASYLSPNVNTVQALEVAARVYGVSILMSQFLVELMRDMIMKCRLLDCVIVPGSAQAMKLYTIDLDCQSLQVDPHAPAGKVWNSRQRFRARQFLEAQRQMKWTDGCKMIDMFELMPEVQLMRRRYTKRFTQIFGMAYQNYSEGEWKVAKSLLSETRHVLGHEDGPSLALLRFMALYDYDAPDGWRGYHELSDLGVHHRGH